jgi:hypothetical protein
MGDRLRIRTSLLSSSFAAWVIATAFNVVSPTSAGAAPADFAILTPDFPREWGVLAQSMGPLDLALGRLNPAPQTGKAKELNKMLVQHKIDFAQRFNAAIELAIQQRQKTFVKAPIVRSSKRLKEGIAREEIPEHVDAKYLLDITVTGVDLLRKTAAGEYRPLVGVSYRLLDTSGVPIDGTYRVFYDPAPYTGDGKSPPNKPHLKYVETDPECVFATMDDLESRLTRFQQCLDGVLREIATEIIDQSIRSGS